MNKPKHHDFSKIPKPLGRTRKWLPVELRGVKIVRPSNLEELTKYPTYKMRVTSPEWPYMVRGTPVADGDSIEIDAMTCMELFGANLARFVDEPSDWDSWSEMKQDIELSKRSSRVSF
jgi:hypothetical protein